MLNEYPKRTFGKEKRSFQSEWFKTFPWLEYSVSQDAAFCFACRFFSTESGRCSSLTTKDGYNNWKKALSADAGIKKHENVESHKKSCAAWEEYRRMKIRDPQTSVGTLISDAYAIKVRENRMYIGQIIEILRFTAVQGIAQRGNDETKDSENRGNFLELLQLISKNNPIVENKLKEGPKMLSILIHQFRMKS